MAVIRVPDKTRIGLSKKVQAVAEEVKRVDAVLDVGYSGKGTAVRFPTQLLGCLGHITFLTVSR